VRVGELARTAGLTVRTLHHYDQIGLLVPERSAGGQRVYGQAEVRRLYQIMSLRKLGMPLEEIAACLRRDGADPRQLIREHLGRLDHQIQLQSALREQLARILDALDQDADASSTSTTDEFVHAIEVMSRMERYYSQEQLAQLEQRRTELGDDAIRRAEQDWAELIAEVEAERAAGTDPASERVQQLRRRWEALIEQFTGGDPGIRASLARMYRSEGVERASQGMVSAELMAYVQRAIDAG
jgi:DNA-binding transcriptional MerR regulator